MKIKNYILAAVSCVLVSCSALELGPIDNYGLNNYWNNKEQCTCVLLASVEQKCLPFWYWY